jgi:Lrp/AsnC family leucine-responsive transcriptional regulator
MATKTQLDALDRKILRVLAADGRSSYQAIGEAVGLSRPAVMKRVRRLEQGGFVQGYAVQLDRARAGFGVTAFVAVRYHSSEYQEDEQRLQALQDHPGVLECHQVAGDDCYILKVAAPHLEGVQSMLREITGGRPHLNTRTTIVLGTLFEKPAFVLPERD